MSTNHFSLTGWLLTTFTSGPMAWIVSWMAFSIDSLAAPAPTSPSIAIPVVFNRDIRPIFSENCASCHGADPASRKAGLRLDTQEGLYSPTPKRGPVVTPGRLEKSVLWSRISTRDPDEIMPPPKSHKTLRAEQIQMIRRWILEGAPWQPHWSFMKPERPPVPSAGAFQSRVRNPIDAFTFSRLEKRGLSPAPEADRRTLARRLSLDLVGLPPLPEEVEAFVKDRSSDFYERYVDRLLASSHWGEHRGRYWLDVARYADTHGLHFDNYREMWPYRDWVIDAFNRNLPFDQFTLEQLAGDLLPHPTRDQIIATGFQRCNPTTNEGGSIEDENLVNYARDRVETLSWAWLGLTANCSVCHDHKFDPITARDFYSMSAFFRNTTQTGFDGNVKESSPALILVKTDAERMRLDALPGELDQARKAFDKARKDAEPDFTNWVNSVRADAILESILPVGLDFHLPLNEGRSNEVVVISRTGTNAVRCISPARVNAKGRGDQPTLHWDAGALVELPVCGDVERDQAFSVGGWIWVPGDFDGKAPIVSRMTDGPQSRGWDLEQEHGHYSVHFIHEWPDDAIRLRTKFRVARKGGWQHVLFTHDGTGKPEGIRLYVDGRAVEVETDRVRSLRGSIRTGTPMRFASTPRGPRIDGLSVQDFRIYGRRLRSDEVRLIAEESTARDWLSKPVADRKADFRPVLLDHYLATQSTLTRDALVKVQALERENDGFRFSYPATHIQKEKAEPMGMAHILFRGQYDKPKDKVEPNVFAFLNPFPAQAPRNRLGLAQWLTSAENPLVARVTVNRFWQELFGVGLVKTSEDFGIMGETPLNQELLDWLAVEFREGGWDVKKFFRKVVTSSTYRQSAETTPEKLEKDPGNRWFSRGPRFRMDAEMVRDYALATSELLNNKLGGPSVRPYQPEGVWEAVAMPESNTRYYHPDTGEALYRRSLYTFWKRAAPPASMDLFNAPSRETSCLRRERTNTPLQALATLNDPQFVEAARHLAETAIHSGRARRKGPLEIMSLRLLSRSLRPQEREWVMKLWTQFRDYYQTHPDEVAQLLGVGESRVAKSDLTPDLAAWTLVANQLMNLDEVLNK